MSWIRGLAAVFYLAVALVILEAAASLHFIYNSRQASTELENVIYLSNVRDAAGTSLWLERWESYKPGASMSLDLPNGQHYSIRISKDGFRTKDIGPKAEGVYRVLAIGGSTTVQGETNDTTYPAYLERLLATQPLAKRVEVYNLGISGTRSDYWLTHLDRLLALQPDMVIQYNAINDLAAAQHYAAHYQQHPWRAFWRGRMLVQRLWPASPEEFAPVYEGITANMLALQQRLKAQGIAYITATFAMPEPQDLSPAFRRFLDYNVAVHWGKAARYAFYDDFYRYVQAHNDYLQATLARAGVTVVPLHQRIHEEKFFIDACHMTDAGIQQQAAAFAEAVAHTLQAVTASE